MTLALAARTRKMNKVESAEVATREPRGRGVALVTGGCQWYLWGAAADRRERWQIAFAEEDENKTHWRGLCLRTGLLKGIA